MPARIRVSAQGEKEEERGDGRGELEGWMVPELVLCVSFWAMSWEKRTPTF